jgi:hypothetical protein
MTVQDIDVEIPCSSQTRSDRARDACDVLHGGGDTYMG